ncbi:MAG: TIGR03943 family protein [Bifidobacterium aquikefiri]|uniref:DUF1980 domain-containing protein n=1 Tax=Bifidobacterium aquikefiri TaxID=1653207 RepID=A0A261G6T0_9BIFI|nr:TIGR03943 family protein [Bifidobacterium aquikefiri]OZG67112.1 hypothetical protein BAQU_1184 [Bifidobacterium aquikefiri]
MNTQQCDKANSIDIIQGVLFLLLATAIAGFIATGRYINYVTPRTVPYAVIAAIVFVAFAVASCCGIFHSNMKALEKIVIVLVIPILLLVLPVQSSSASGAGLNRAIAINDAASARLSGLNEAKKTITISDDEFGAWYDRIDRNASEYMGYTIILNGTVSKDSSVGRNQFTASRMLMTCCVLDMTAFGFVVNAKASTMPKENAWVTVSGTLSKGTIGTSSHHYQGLLLSNATIITTSESGTGYFYHQ